MKSKKAFLSVFLLIAVGLAACGMKAGPAAEPEKAKGREANPAREKEISPAKNARSRSSDAAAVDEMSFSDASEEEFDLRADNRIRFKPGASSARVAGKIENGEGITYVIGARAGQNISVEITDGGSANDVVFYLVAPDGSWPMGGEEGPEYDAAWRGKLPQTGDYRIVVGAIESDEVDFKMSVSITGGK